MCGVVALYSVLVARAFWLGLRCIEMKRHFSGYLAFGIALWISLQTFVSIGVNLGLLPTKGLTLPLISSGGSSVMMTCVILGVLLRVSYEADRAQRQRHHIAQQGSTASVAVHLHAPRSPSIAATSAPKTMPHLASAPVASGRVA